MSKTIRAVALGTLVLLGVLLTACVPSTPQSVYDETNSMGQTQEPGLEQREVDAVQEAAENEISPTESKADKQSSTENNSPKPSAASKISFGEVRSHDTREDCWIVLLGDVYNFTPVVQQHPFGAQLSNAVCGKDATETLRQNADLDDVVERLSPLYLGPVS